MKKSVRSLFTQILLVILLSGCCTNNPVNIITAKDFQTIDKINNYVNRWGTISISSPFISKILAEKEFDLNLTGKDLYEGIDINGNVKVSKAISTHGKMDIRATADGITALPLTSNEADTDKAVSDIEKFATVTEYNLDKNNISQRLRIRQAASDYMELNLHKFFSNPEKNGLLKNQECYLLTFTVSCLPGWETRTRYTGNIDLRLDYEIRDIDLDIPIFPSVGAIYPSNDNQELNLSSYYKNLLALASRIAAQYQSVATDILLNYADKLESGSGTITPFNQITSYSNGGRNFGYQFHPTFQAIGDPTKFYDRPNFVLKRFTFPTIAIICIDNEELDLFLKKTAKRISKVIEKNIALKMYDLTNKKENMNKIAKQYYDNYGNNKSEAEILKDLKNNLYLKITCTHNWNNETEPSNNWNWFWSWLWFIDYKEQYSISDYISIVNELNSIKSKTQKIKPIDENNETLSNQISSLSSRLKNQSPDMRLPIFIKEKHFETMKMSDMYPNFGFTGEKCVFYITGENFTKKMSAFFISNKKKGDEIITNKEDIKIEFINDNFIIITISGKLTDNSGNDFVFLLEQGEKDNKQSAYTKPFNLIKKPQISSTIKGEVQSTSSDKSETLIFTAPNNEIMKELIKTKISLNKNQKIYP